MRILVADYAGHPFQVQLSRTLARRGHQVRHLFSAAAQTPKGDLVVRENDPKNFDIVGVSLDEPIDKYNFIKRRRQESEIGRRFAEIIRSFAPDIAILANVPIDTLAQVVPALTERGCGFVFWLQDLLGEAAYSVLSKRFGVIGRLVGAHYRRRERRFLAAAGHIVAISEDFRPVLTRVIGIDDRNVSVIENWAPLESVPEYLRDNDWVTANLPGHPFRIIYSGTLGMKQNPEVLLRLAAEVDSSVVIFSEGPVARQLADQAAQEGLTNLTVRGWLDLAELPKALAGADLLVVTLEPDAGVFSVPSKVLTYMCVGRAILGAVPQANLAARLIRDNDCGIVVEPGDTLGIVEAAKRLAADKAEREWMGRAGRAYAERTFEIEGIADRFEAVIRNITAKGKVHE